MTAPERVGSPAANQVQARTAMGIALRTALLSWLVTIGTVSIFVIAIIPFQKRTFLENLESKAHGVAVSLRDVAAGAAVNEDYSSVVDHCKEMLAGDRSLEYLVITKNNGFSLIHDRSGWRAEPQASQEWHPVLRQPVSGLGTVALFGRRVFHFSQPFDYSGIEWGWIHVGLSLETYDRSVAAVYQRTGLLALACIGFSLIASLIYARRIVRPIFTLQAVVQKVADGDLSVRAVVDRGDELGHLAAAVNSMTEALLRRDTILQSVSFAAQKFLSTPNWQEVINQVLAKIGEAAGVCRVYIWKIDARDSASQTASCSFLWIAPGLDPDSGLAASPGLSGETARLRRWIVRLRRGEIVTVRAQDQDPAERELLERQGSKSLMLIPIQVEQAWWGVLGLDDCQYERWWTDAEQSSMRAAAGMLGAAIARLQMQEALVEAKQTLEQRVEERTKELQEQAAARERAHRDLAYAQNQLIQASRQAGMAEVATGVLHNVGNVLNSINVSTSLIKESLRQSEIATLPKLTALLREHLSDLPAFLTTDAKGKLVLPFILELNDHLVLERQNLQTEHAQLTRNVEHVKEIVAMQQNYASMSGLVETVSVPEVVNDALQINLAGLARHGVQVTRSYAEVPSLALDRHKVLQILINLIRNAKYALRESGRADKHLTVAIGLNGNHRIKIQVTDNGIGIPPENLTRIFSHGFTTKKDGHGFGLHSGANTAKEMGGLLQAHSEGLGKGATFTLELPLISTKS